MNILIAIDDTDNHQSRGTGYRARQLAELISSNGLAQVNGITRHQLLVHEDIPYTSHNSSACISVKVGKLEKIIYICRTFLRAESAIGSDAGLCVAPEDLVTEEVMQWGWRAKKEVLTMKEAIDLAERSYIYLEGLTGTHGGIIGSLAAVGLVKAGNDGRYLWIQGMRKYMGVMKTKEVLKKTGIDQIQSVDGNILENGARIMMPDWWRPILKDHKAVLMVEPNTDNELYEYKVISKGHLKKLSS
jgi:tRNA(Ile2) C34 agmatinyltransferase TiaS